MNDMIQPPEPGVYEDVPMATYNSWDCARSSTLGQIATGASPAHVRYDILKSSNTPAKGVGTAVHTAAWEPELYQGSVEVWTETKTRAKGFLARQEQIPEGHVLLTQDEAAKVMPMVASIQAHPTASMLLKATAQRELSIVFDLDYTVDDVGSMTGNRSVDYKLRTKARLDGFAPKIHTIVDLKTTQSASPQNFAYSIRKYGYHRQAALYREAAQAAGLDVAHHVIVAVENEEPYKTAVYRITDDAIVTAWEELVPAIEVLGTCYETGEWPAYSDHIIDIGLPE